ncbi:hypothetical protein [Sulfitobacter geojensis]|uniref:hypothetical protein n=1 Tax=Sulfitobacter geojensis TaxID=1342299 RepID=UPI0004692904|nr:hypothetical protein [Sulfitobacter geojensis]KHA53926.1 hypothetical protein Z947_273 [Sulfitobacter geojensis]NYI30162.1 hypothetical protein [Sulfitobacter geojensis]
MLFKRLFLTTLATTIALATSSFAQETPVFSLELNGATETEAGSCRLTYVAANRTGNALDRTAYEVAVFDSQGAVTRLLVLEFGDLVEGKTKILQFDLAGTPCGAISRIVVNDAAACVVAGAESPICMQSLTASSRTAIQFGI